MLLLFDSVCFFGFLSIMIWYLQVLFLKRWHFKKDLFLLVFEESVYKQHEVEGGGQQDSTESTSGAAESHQGATGREATQPTQAKG